jgi:hypothetical protein
MGSVEGVLIAVSVRLLGLLGPLEHFLNLESFEL